MTLLFPFAGNSLVADSCCEDNSAADTLEGIHKQAMENLKSNVMGFWVEHGYDEEFGGFYTNLDRRGNKLPDGTKRLLMQVRTIWSLAAAHRHGITDKGYLEMAAKGVDFVEKHYRDDQFGGYYLVCDREGKVIDKTKRIYHLSFLIYGYSEYALASGDKEVLAKAEVVFDLIQEKALEKDGSYFEDFDQQWNRLYQNSIYDMENIKTLNTHMHLLESFTNLYLASGKAKHREALERVYRLILEKSIDPDMGYAYEPYNLNFEPVFTAVEGSRLTSYSHNVELSWLLVEAADALGIPRPELKDVVLDLVDHALQYGYDWKLGGLATNGPIDKAVADFETPHSGMRKGWWEQSETLIACLYAYQLKPDARYLKAYILTWKWIWDHQVDHEFGDWYAITEWETGNPFNTLKGSNGWKTAYHTSRSLMHMDFLTRQIVENRAKCSE